MLMRRGSVSAVWRTLHSVSFSIEVKDQRCLRGGGRLTFDGCRTTFDCEEDGEDGVGDAVVGHVAFPLHFYFAVGGDFDEDGTHDFKDGFRGSLDLLVGFLFFLRSVGVTIDGFRGRRYRFDGSESAFQSPFYQVYARGRQSQSLAAYDGRSGQARVLLEIFRRHEAEFEVVLDKYTGN